MKPSTRAEALLLSAVAVALSACGKTPPPQPPQLPPITIAAPPETKVKAVMTLDVSRDVNPDASGRPSPVIVHVYQLRGDAAFQRVEFFDLMDDSVKALGEVLISRDEFSLQPGERRMLDVTVANEAAFVGVAAEYRAFRTAEWRAIVPAPRQAFTVSVEKARVAVALGP
jgi:type VI secretion system protein VasD